MKVTTTKHLEVYAKYPKGEVSARYAEENFALSVVAPAMPEGGRVSNYGVDNTNTSEMFRLYTLVWREADSPWAKERLNDADSTDKWLRDAVPDIKAALGDDYKDVKIVLVTNVSTAEDL